jgi:hypothetical protein
MTAATRRVLIVPVMIESVTSNASDALLRTNDSGYSRVADLSRPAPRLAAPQSDFSISSHNCQRVTRSRIKRYPRTRGPSHRNRLALPARRFSFELQLRHKGESFSAHVDRLSWWGSTTASNCYTWRELCIWTDSRSPLVWVKQGGSLGRRTLPLSTSVWDGGLVRCFDGTTCLVRAFRCWCGVALSSQTHVQGSPNRCDYRASAKSNSSASAQTFKAAHSCKSLVYRS